MLKMYEAEVLGKLPVIQHFLFGSLLPWDGPPAPDSTLPTSHSHAHAHCDHHSKLPPHVKIHPSRPQSGDVTELGAAGQREVGWGDCCGIPVPSVFGAAAAEKDSGREIGRRLEGVNIRPVPFD